MADKAFDAVIVGGGNKGLLVAMYLITCGGMNVGIFERRHDIGGCLATAESSAPGFRGKPRGEAPSRAAVDGVDSMLRAEPPFESPIGG